MRKWCRYAFGCMYCAGFFGIVLIYGIFAVIVAHEQADTPATVARAQQSLPRVGVFSEPWSDADRSEYAGRYFYQLSTEYLLYAHGLNIVRIPSVADVPARVNIDALLIDVKEDILRHSDVVRAVYNQSVIEGIPILAVDRGALTLVRLECGDDCVASRDLQNYTTHAQRVNGFFEDAADLLRESILSFDSTIAVPAGSAKFKPLVECNDRSGRPFIAAFSAGSTSSIIGVTFDLDARTNLGSIDLANIVMKHFTSKVLSGRAHTNAPSQRTSLVGGRIADVEGNAVVIAPESN